MDVASLLKRPVAELMAEASARRDKAWGRTITYSPKAFLPVTNLCRNRCDYCTFRKNPTWDGAHTMSPDEVMQVLRTSRDAGCIEALLCLGDQPEAVFDSYRRQLADWGFDSTVAYLEWISLAALELGMLPHTNAGVLSHDEMARLRPVNASLGLMLENVSPRLCEKGMPHHRAPDKRPERRLAMHREAGELKIPFTSGLLIGIGETPEEQLETLVAIAEVHSQYGHIQEVIVQNFRTKPTIPMAGAPEPQDLEIARAVAWARLVLPDEVTVQAPPNLNPAALELLVDAGINDLGGISPVTPDFINPGHPWPHLDALSERLAARDFGLSPRLPIHASYVVGPEWVAPSMRPHIQRALEQVPC